MAGVSRSSSIIIHHIMMTGTNLRQAIQLVKTARPVVQPNKAFARALVAAELEQRGENSIEAEEISSRGLWGGGGRREEDVRNMMDSFGGRGGRCAVL